MDIILLPINFRLHLDTLVGDIRKMFYCINLDERHRGYYPFLWNGIYGPTEETKIYRFKRLALGSVDFPFLVINTAHHHLDQIIKTNPKLKQAAAFIKTIYILMTSLDLRTQLKKQLD